MKQTVFKKVYVKDRLPTSFGEYFTDLGLLFYNNGQRYWTNNIQGRRSEIDIAYPKWFLEEIELPSEEEIIEQISELPYDDNMSPNDVGIQGANYILNKLK